MSKAIEITDSNFEEIVSSSNVPVLVDFWAEWCGPCKMIGPVVDELAGEYAGKAVIGKINIDENPETAAKFMVRSIPTLLILKGGEVVDKHVGAAPKSTLAQKINNQL